MEGRAFMDATSWELFARCAYGFERVLAQELKDLGMRRVRPLKGGVAFYGGQADAYRACLWSCVATRIQLVIGRVPAVTSDELYTNVRSIAWERHVRRGSTIAIDAHGTNACLRNTAFTALKAKDALCDHLRMVWGERPTVDARHPDAALDIALHEKKATLYFNLSGPSLHRRGYREDGVQTEAPLKETLAAGLLLMAGWPSIAAQGGVLVDPMCGSGTIAIEGALMAANIAPGMLRQRWGFEGWALHDELLWAEVLAEASLGDASRHAPFVIAGDIDARSVKLARANARRAGVESRIQFYTDDAANLSRHLRGVKKRRISQGLLASNPPYGERMGAPDELAAVHASLAEAVGALPEGWRCALITPNVSVDTALGRLPEQVTECYNGPLEVYLRLYDISHEQHAYELVSLSGTRRSVALGDEHSLQFASRLRKVARERLRWARKSGIDCLRLYDADLPDFRLSVDLYESDEDGKTSRYLSLCEHNRPRSVDGQAAERRLSDASAIACAVLDVDASHVVVRSWADRAQTRKASPVLIRVKEEGLAFEVDLMGRPDTGLPLIQRGLRRRMREHADQGDFINLFGTSAAASVCAAAGGATSTLTIEPFADRAQRIRHALDVHGYDDAAHRVVERDTAAWLEQEARAGHSYSTILCVPPSWLPDEQMPAVAKGTAAILARQGTIVLAGIESCVLPWKAEYERAGLVARDVSDQVREPDFARTHDPLLCYLLAKS